ncbi:hypothetical protein O181_023520 [Austropuccinia psidii MF-1]|uniref:Integrase catalytic domain-containing protein n=1 Tax=Austropuccinia psidii MF-1 TaxID=1389203 RepID=A0A9Q3GZ60_9BASI|nr:hypothetical protein [Austropuccinia psidii MF-1]
MFQKSRKLLSAWEKLWDNRFSMTRGKNNRFSAVKGNSILMEGEVKDNMFQLDINIIPPKCKDSERKATSSEVLHNRSGNPGKRILKDMFPNVKNILFRRITPPSLGVGNYYLKMTDDYSQYKTVYIIINKSDEYDVIKDYLDEVKRKHNTSVNMLVNDNGGDYISNKIQSLILDKGIRMIFTASYTPQQNPIAERRNRSTTEKARSLLFKANIPAIDWGEAVLTSKFIENITPSSAINNQSSYPLWNKREFNLKHLRPFGCLFYVNIPKALRDGRSSVTSKREILLGYDINGPQNWRIILNNGKITRINDLLFDKNSLPDPVHERPETSSNIII